MRSHLLASALLIATGCTTVEPPASTTATEVPAVRQLSVDVISTSPHDPSAFTQGLEIDGSDLYEGTGLRNQSMITRTNLDTGTEQARQRLDAELFGEGITVAGPRVWQLTWESGVAIERDPESLEETGRADYDGEGWGLCAQPERLVMSDGSATLTFRDPETFAETATVEVTEDGSPVTELNELECTDEGRVWANVWQTDRILEIDPATGAVVATVDASGLLEPDEADAADVLNGIAAIPGTDEFLITGKLWPTTFRVRFGPAAEPE